MNLFESDLLICNWNIWQTPYSLYVGCVLYHFAKGRASLVLYLHFIDHAYLHKHERALTRICV